MIFDVLEFVYSKFVSRNRTRWLVILNTYFTHHENCVIYNYWIVLLDNIANINFVQVTKRKVNDHLLPVTEIADVSIMYKRLFCIYFFDTLSLSRQYVYKCVAWLFVCFFFACVQNKKIDWISRYWALARRAIQHEHWREILGLRTRIRRTKVQLRLIATRRYFMMWKPMNITNGEFVEQITAKAFVRTYRSTKACAVDA